MATGVGASMPLTMTRTDAAQAGGSVAGAGPATSRTILRTSGRSRVRLGPPIGGDTAAGTTAGPAGDASLGSAIPATGDAATRTVSPTVADVPLVGGLRPSFDGESPTTVGAGIRSPSDDENTWTAPSGLVLARMVAADVSSPGQSFDAPDPSSDFTGSTAHVDGPRPDGPLVGSDPLTRTTWSAADQVSDPVGPMEPATLAPGDRAPRARANGGGSASAPGSASAVTTSAAMALQRSVTAADAGASYRLPSSGRTPATTQASAAADASSGPSSWTRHAVERELGSRIVTDPAVGRRADALAVRSRADAFLQRSPTATSLAGIPPTAAPTDASAALVLARQVPRASAAAQPGESVIARSEVTGVIREHAILGPIQRDGESPAAAPAAGNGSAPPTGSSNPTPGAQVPAGVAADPDARLLRMEEELRRMNRMYEMLSNIIKARSERMGQIAANLRG